MVKHRAVLRATGLATVALLLIVASGPGYAQTSTTNAPRGYVQRKLELQHRLRAGQVQRGSTTRHSDDANIASMANEYAQERSLPGTHVSAEALLSARQEAADMPTLEGRWQEQTDVPYDLQPAGYNDPVWSDAFPPPGAGFSLVGGRITALAADGNTLYAGAADGGVWLSKNSGASWQPLSDTQPTLSIGALAINPGDHSLWVGTGEANTSVDSYQGTGVYRLQTHADGEDEGDSEQGARFQRVGGTELVSRTVYQLEFDGVGGVYAATNGGLFKTRADGSGSWTAVLKPDPTDSFPPYTNHITTVVVRPGTSGRQVAAVDGWRSGSPFNAFFASTDGGNHFKQIAPKGIDLSDIGRTTMTYASDGRLYMLMESPAALLANAPSLLKGVYVSRSGDANGPWTQIADYIKLENSGSALTAALQPGFEVGVQAWYNQTLATDPADPNRLYVGLEEVFQTTDGGKTFRTASPYWNFGLACNPNCPNTTHPDQHVLLVRNGRIILGNDGGVYSRPLSDTGYGDWSDLNATLHNLQYYDARAGQNGSDVAFWGGLQDNATSFLPHPHSLMVSPASGDGFNVIVDPANAHRAVGEYTNLATYLTTDGGHSFVTASPSCVGQAIGFNGATFGDCEDAARFWAPYAADQLNINHWIGAGRYVWETTLGWDTQCNPITGRCDWKRQFDLGPATHGTAVTGAGATEYVAWVRGSGNPSRGFKVGIATTYGGTWHQLDVSSLPNRFIAGVTVDTNDPAHVFAVFNGYSRRWIPGGGQGIVFESHDAGASWTNISANLPDAPGNALVIVGSHLVLGTDVGVFVSSATDDSFQWARLGRGLPNASANDVTLAPDGRTIVAGTHGRGIWTFTLGGEGDNHGDRTR
jgi:hypothetical protein